MVDPIAVWGAITGTAAVALTVRREVISNRRSLRVDFGWNWIVDGEKGELIDYYVYVMVTNTGARDITVMHAGLGWPTEVIQEGGDDEPTYYAGRRVEFFFDDPIHLKVDGPPVKIDASGGSLAHLFDPLTAVVQPMAFTGGGNEAHLGPVTPFLRNVPMGLTEEALVRGFQRLKEEAVPPQRSAAGDGLSAVLGHVRGTADDYRRKFDHPPHGALRQDSGNSRADGDDELISEFDHKPDSEDP